MWLNCNSNSKQDFQHYMHAARRVAFKCHVHLPGQQHQFQVSEVQYPGSVVKQPRHRSPGDW